MRALTRERNVGIARCESEMAIMQGSCPKCNAKWAIQDWVNARFVCPTCAHQLISGSIIAVHSHTGRILTPCTVQRAQQEVEAGRAQWIDDHAIRLVGSLVNVQATIGPLCFCATAINVCGVAFPPTPWITSSPILIEGDIIPLI